MSSHFHIWHPGTTALSTSSRPFPETSAQAASFACDRLLRLVDEAQNTPFSRRQHRSPPTVCRNPFADLPEKGPWLDTPRLGTPAKDVDQPMENSPPKSKSPTPSNYSTSQHSTTPERLPRWAFFSDDSTDEASPAREFRVPVQKNGSRTRRTQHVDPLQVAIECAVEDRTIPTEAVAQFAVSRRRTDSTRRTDICRFCYERAVKYNERYNRERPRVDDEAAEWTQHTMRDPETRKVLCPRLRNVKCEICLGTGDNAHIAKYCPLLRDSHFLATQFGRNNNRLDS